MPRLSRKALAHLVLLIYLALLLLTTLSPVPGPRTTLAFLGELDKLAHLLLFAGLGAVLYWNLALALKKRIGVMALLASGAAAALIEFLQEYIPYRSAELWDLVAGAGGAILSVTAMTLFWRRLPERGSPDSE